VRNLSTQIKPTLKAVETSGIWVADLRRPRLHCLPQNSVGDGMDLPPEYVLHLLPLMAICGIPPPQPPPSSPSEKRTERSPSFTKPGSPRPTPTLASIPYIDQDLGRAILKIIDQWRTLALWEPFASKERQIPGASLEGMFRVIPVDRVCSQGEDGLTV
jgi:hypothetical protein